MINRRHHCRNCGKVVCGGCSKNSLLLVNISSKPSRVCDGCWDDHKRTQDYFDNQQNCEYSDHQINDENSSDSDSESKSKKLESSKSLEDLDMDQPTFYRSVNDDDIFVALNPAS